MTTTTMTDTTAPDGAHHGGTAQASTSGSPHHSPKTDKTISGYLKKASQTLPLLQIKHSKQFIYLT
jgi:hypothetical protein